MFTQQPMAYVCQGTRRSTQETAPVLEERICTKASGQLIKDGKSLTPCRFILTGACSDPASVTVTGETFQEVIYTYLQDTR